MSMLAAVFSAGAGRATVSAELERMITAMDAEGSSHAVVGSDAGCATVVQAHDRCSSFARDEQLQLSVAFVGELYEPVSDDEDLTTAEQCLRLYRARGEELATALNGHFNLVIIDERAGRMAIATDPFGYRPLFFAHDGGRFLFATQMKGVRAALDSTAALDPLGLVQQFRYGCPIGNRTWLQGVELLDPGTWYRLDRHGLAKRRYFRFQYRRHHRTLSLEEHSRALSQCLQTAVSRSTRGFARVGLPLSGGLDSRALLIASRLSGGVPTTYTFGDPRSRDGAAAAQLAAAAAVGHYPLRYRDGYLAEIIRDVVRRTDGLLPFAEATFSSLHFHDQLAAHADLLLYGHCGDALTGAHLPLTAELWRSRSRAVEWTARNYFRVPHPQLRRVFRADTYRRAMAELPAALSDTFATIDQDHPADLLDVWDMENRQRRGTFASVAVDRGRFAVRAPFLERAVVDLLCRTPLRWRMQQIAYKRMIVSSFPPAARIAWAHTGAVLAPQRSRDFASQCRAYWQRRTARRLRRAAPLEFRNLEHDTRADRQLPAIIREFTADSCFPDQIFDRRGIEDIVDAHWQQGENLTQVVTMIATFAVAIPALFENKANLSRKIAPTCSRSTTF